MSAVLRNFFVGPRAPTKREQWLAVRATPRNLAKLRQRIVWTGGTYVRPRGNAVDDARLSQFQAFCNRGYERHQRNLALAKKLP